MVRRELAVGDSVAVRWGGDASPDGTKSLGIVRELRAVVSPLPFGR
jgi:hypothetical protein